MNAALHRPRPGETNLELLGLGASAGAAAWGCAWVGLGLPLPRCAFHALTGCPCPTCGATRCVLALLHGRVAEAIAWNPMAFAALAVIALLNVYAAAALALRLPRVRLRLSPAELRVAGIVGLLVVAANWAYLIRHGV
jgi:hypothetical protein